MPPLGAPWDFHHVGESTKRLLSSMTKQGCNSSQKPSITGLISQEQWTTGLSQAMILCCGQNLPEWTPRSARECMYMYMYMYFSLAYFSFSKICKNII